jgi:hypothetical protein
MEKEGKLKITTKNKLNKQKWKSSSLNAAIGLSGFWIIKYRVCAENKQPIMNITKYII